MKKDPRFLKIITFALILILILINFSPVTIGISKYQIVKQLKDKIKEKLQFYSLVNKEPSYISMEPDSSKWIQVIGDYPKGEMNNGFNNSRNVAIRGKTTFTVKDKEYLFLGTGNIITAPLNPELLPIFISNFFHKIAPSLKQVILNLLVRAMENYFKDCDTQGLELWYYDNQNWKQSVGNDLQNASIGRGFNNKNNMELTMLKPYKPVSGNDEFLYAGTFNPREGLEIWRTTNPIDGPWEPIIYNNGEAQFSSGFGNPDNLAAYSSAIFDGWLYIGTMNWEEGCEIWRTNGNIWEKVIGSGCSIVNGFGDDEVGFERDIYAWDMKVFEDVFTNQNFLYVGTFNIAGCELWRTSDGFNWTCLVGNEGVLKRGFNMFGYPLRTHNYGIRRLEVFKNSLYIGTASVPPFGLEINGNNMHISNVFLESIGSGCCIWKFDGLNFEKIIGRKFSFDEDEHSGFGDWTNAYVWSLREFDGRLFAGTWNPGRFLTNISFQLEHPLINISLTTDESQSTNTAGCEVWFTEDGNDWHQMVGDEINKKHSEWPANGFGDSSDIGARALIEYKNCLYLGITNIDDGCELWKFDGSSYPN